MANIPFCAFGIILERPERRAVLFDNSITIGDGEVVLGVFGVCNDEKRLVFQGGSHLHTLIKRGN